MKLQKCFVDQDTSHDFLSALWWQDDNIFIFLWSAPLNMSTCAHCQSISYHVPPHFPVISCQHVCLCTSSEGWIGLLMWTHQPQACVCARLTFCHRNVPLTCNKVNVSVSQSVCHHLTAGWQCFLCVEDFIVSAAGFLRFLIARVCVCNGVIENKEHESSPLLENYLGAQWDARDFSFCSLFQKEKIHFRVEHFHFPTSRLSRWHLILAAMC